MEGYETKIFILIIMQS